MKVVPSVGFCRRGRKLVAKVLAAQLSKGLVSGDTFVALVLGFGAINGRERRAVEVIGIRLIQGL